MDSPTVTLTNIQETIQETVLDNSDITEMDSFIPKDLEMPVIGIAIVFAILMLLGLVKNFSTKGKAVQFESKEGSFKSPVKSGPNSTSTPIDKKTGTIMTPAGRRSARLARRKED